jgi:hypothetical protein
LKRIVCLFILTQALCAHIDGLVGSLMFTPFL